MDHQGAVFSFQDGYVLVQEPPDYVVDRHQIGDKLKAIAEYCAKVGSYKVMSVGPSATIRLSTLEIYQAGVYLAQLSLKLAVVFDEHDLSPRDVEFVKDVASNRGAEIGFFTNQSDALQWLGICQPTVD